MREYKFRAAVNIKDKIYIINDVVVYNSAEQIGFSDDAFQEFVKQLGDKYRIDYDNDCVEYSDEENDEYEVVLQFVQGDDWIYLNFADVEIMQFTGLKDKNGVEIYD